MNEITFLDVIQGVFYGSVGIIIIGSFLIIFDYRRKDFRNGWIETIIGATVMAVVSVGAWIYHGLTGDESLELVITLLVIAMIMMFLTVPLRVWLQKKGNQKENKSEDEAFQLWAVITDGTTGIRTLEEDRELHRICRKICRNLTKKELESLLSIKEEIWKNSKELCDLLSEQH